MPFTQEEAMEWMGSLLDIRREIEGASGSIAAHLDELIEGIERDAEAGGFYTELEKRMDEIAAVRARVEEESVAALARRLAEEHSSLMTMEQTRAKWEKSILASAKRGFRSREFSMIPLKPEEIGSGYPFDDEEDAEPYAAMMRNAGFEARVKRSDGATRFVVKVRW